MQNDLFEKWYIENHPNSSLEKAEDGNYFRRKASLAWEAWQASAQRQGYKLVPVDPTEKSLMWLMFDSGFEFDNVQQAEIFYKAMIGAVDEQSISKPRW